MRETLSPRSDSADYKATVFVEEYFLALGAVFAMIPEQATSTVFVTDRPSAIDATMCPCACANVGFCLLIKLVILLVYLSTIMFFDGVILPHTLRCTLTRYGCDSSAMRTLSLQSSRLSVRVVRVSSGLLSLTNKKSPSGFPPIPTEMHFATTWKRASRNITAPVSH
ncbi:hypothetical protein F5146DRAFT_285271 [Armillaria mellea]|nr:hypothetical protein F5146DRAFT_285271 [Armillaria mellea]